MHFLVYGRGDSKCFVQRDVRDGCTVGPRVDLVHMALSRATETYFSTETMVRDGHIKRIGLPLQSEMMLRVQIGKGRLIVRFAAVVDSIELAPEYKNDFHTAVAIQND